MRMYIHTSLLTYLRPEFCFIWAAGGVGGLKGDVTGVGNPLDALKDPSDDLGDRSADFGVLHSPAYVTAYSKIALTSNALYCTTFSFTRQTLVTFAPADPIAEEKTVVKNNLPKIRNLYNNQRFSYRYIFLLIPGKYTIELHRVDAPDSHTV